MKRTTVALGAILLLLLTIAVWYFSPGPRPDNIFHIEDSSVVTLLEMEKVVRGEKVEEISLEKQNTGEWLVDGQHTAIQAKVDNLLKTLTQIRVVGTIEAAGQESALKLLKKNHTRVRISGQDGEILEYLIGATNSQHSANIMLVDGAEKAHLVSKPGLQGYVSVFYSTRTIEWRERVLFNLTPNNLKRIHIQYPSSNSQIGFDLKRDGEGDPWMVRETILADVDRVTGYVNLFEGKISAESFANDAFPEMRDSLEGKTADVIFSYATTDGKSGDLRLFARPENVNNYFGYLEGKPELFTIQRYVMDKYLKTEGYFVPGEVLQAPEM